MAEHYVTQLEIQDLQERYNIVKNKAQVKFIPHWSPYRIFSMCKCTHIFLPQGAVAKAEELVSAHQEYQRCLHEFKDWLEQQQERLSCYTQLEGDVETLEDTLRKLQVRRRNCYCKGRYMLSKFDNLFVHFIFLNFKTSCRSSNIFFFFND